MVPSSAVPTPPICPQLLFVVAGRSATGDPTGEGPWLTINSGTGSSPSVGIEKHFLL